jgi:uncharacterized phage-associated protein
MQNKIADAFIEHSNLVDCTDLTPMKLQKLVFYTYGWFYALTGDKLFEEKFEVWKYGPVIRSLYQRFKERGMDHIDVDSLESPFQPLEEDIKNLVAKIWNIYGHRTAVELSNSTHVKDGPWRKAIEARLPYLQENDVKEYFHSKLLKIEQVHKINS